VIPSKVILTVPRGLFCAQYVGKHLVGKTYETSMKELIEEIAVIIVNFATENL